MAVNMRALGDAAHRHLAGMPDFLVIDAALFQVAAQASRHDATPASAMPDARKATAENGQDCCLFIDRRDTEFYARFAPDASRDRAISAPPVFRFCGRWCGQARKIGRAHVCTESTNAYFVCRLLLVKNK